MISRRRLLISIPAVILIGLLSCQPNFEADDNTDNDGKEIPTGDEIEFAMGGGDPSIIYMANFDNNTFCGLNFSGNAWGKLSNTVSYSKPNSLKVYGRTANSNGISFLLAGLLPRGQTVTFSVWVYPLQNATVRFNVNINGGGGTAVVTKNVPALEWTLAEGDYTVPADARWVRASVYLTGSTCDFHIDNLAIKLKTGSLNSSTIQEDLKPMKDAPAFKERNLLIGAVVNPLVIFDPSGNRQKLLVKHYNSFAPQDELKPAFVLEYPASAAGLPQTNDHAVVNFSMAIPVYEFAKKYNLKMMAHHMVWHTQCPDWFFYENYDDTNRIYVSKEVMLKRMENYIKDVLEWSQNNYPGMVVMWSVVNEAFTGNSPVGMQDSHWFKIMGDEYIARAFEYANKYRTDANIKLIYNDVNMEKYQNRIDYCMNYIKNWNVLLDGIGFQFHIDMTTPTPAVIKTNLERVGDKLEVYVTELDISNTDNSPAGLEAQRTRYKEVYEAILGARVNLKCIRSHGLNDSHSWLINHHDQDEYPLLWDANNLAKPAYYGVMDASP